MLIVALRSFVCDDGDLSPPLLKVVVTSHHHLSSPLLKVVVTSHHHFFKVEFAIFHAIFERSVAKNVQKMR